MKEIKQIYDKLNWNNPIETQAEGRALAKKVADLSLLIQPDGAMEAWKNCAAVLSEKSDEELAPYLDELLKWLQDINWNGALIISNRLNRFYDVRLSKTIENAVAKALKMPQERRRGFKGK